MKGFIKTFIFFIYLILAIFIHEGDVFASDNIGRNFPAQYYISTTKSETNFINNNKEEYYVISKNNNRTEMSNPSSKNHNLGFGNFDKVNAEFVILDNYITDNSIYPCISHNISPNLKNAIYTRAP